MRAPARPHPLTHDTTPTDPPPPSPPSDSAPPSAPCNVNLPAMLSAALGCQEKGTAPLTASFVKLSHPNYRKLPQLTLSVSASPVTFLVDTGATLSVIRRADLPSLPRMSGRYINSVSATGHIVRESFTVPLGCVDAEGKRFKHSFLFSSHCPVSLLGRDLICELGLSLVSTPEGLEVTKLDLDEVQSFVHLSVNTPLYAYQWRLPDGEVTRHLLQAAERVVSPAGTQFVASDSVRCTAHLSLGPDPDYERRWYQEGLTGERLMTRHLYWSACRSALSVALSPGQEKLFTACDCSDVHGELPAGSCGCFRRLRPHVSLSRGMDDTWTDVGSFLTDCVRASDWQATTADPAVFYSADRNAYRMSFILGAHVSRCVRLEDDMDFCLLTDAELAQTPALQRVPSTLWAKGPHDVGLIKNVEPVVITPKSDFRPCQQQYPLKAEAVTGITPVFESLRAAGVIVPCPDSPVRTPIFPVKKSRDNGQPTEWRFVQDLQAVNKAVQARAPLVPNPYTILSQIPSSAKWFSVIDLANAFFSVPVHPDSQFWFAFNFKGEPWTFTRLCQGYCESPTIYNTALRRSLEPLTLSPGTALLQYTDDVLLACPTQQQCEIDTVALLQHLAKEGHKASLSKLQYVKQQVKFLGHSISGDGRSLSPKRVEAIQRIPRPLTKKQVMAFLGMCSYCRMFIVGYAELEAPLASLIHGQGLSAHDRVSWTPEAEEAFGALKRALQSAPALGLPDPARPFTQTVDEKAGFMTSVLLQEHGGALRPVAYFSGKLDPVAAGLPRCLRAVAAAEKAVYASRDLVGYSDLTLLVPHAVSMILLEQKTSHLSAARWLRYQTVLLDLPNVTVKRCNILNPATLMPGPADGEPHDCVAVIDEVCTPRPDLQESALVNPDLVLYVDGSAFKDERTGRNRVGFAVVSDHETLASGSLPHHCSAQAAELVALTEACRLARGKSVTIYTDSRYGFGVCHDFGAIWRCRRFLKSDGKPVLNADKVGALLEAILLPSSIAVCRCPSHVNGSDLISAGNARADAAAKAAARAPVNLCFVSAEAPSGKDDTLASLSAMQTFSSPDEKRLWQRNGCSLVDSVWRAGDMRPCLPKHFFPHFARLAHGLDHASPGIMLSTLTKYWYTKGFSSYAQRFCLSCVICAAHNAGGGVKMPLAAHPQPDRPFEYIMLDFIELSPCEGKKYCLVVVDMFSKWVEVFPSSKADSSTVAKALLTEILPRWGIPSRISSDNGTHFVNEALVQVGQFLGFDLKRHCAYHPASGGAVERENGTLKSKLAKCCAVFSGHILMYNSTIVLSLTSGGLLLSYSFANHWSKDVEGVNGIHCGD